MAQARSAPAVRAMRVFTVPGRGAFTNTINCSRDTKARWQNRFAFTNFFAKHTRLAV